MHRLDWEACYNARDLGGYPTGEGGRTRDGALVRADNLYHLTPAGRAALVGYGVRTIIDLRFPEELVHRPNPFADPAVHNHTLTYHSLPLQGPSTKESEAAYKAANSNCERYCVALDYGMSAFARVMNAIADAPEGTVLVHCHAGRDRTGMVSAMLLKLAGVPDETIAEDYALSDTYIKPLNDQFLQSMHDPRERAKFLHELEIAPATMLGFLAHLKEKHGGAEAYLLAAGVSQERLAKIKRKLVESKS